ncbi:MAG TPA: TonB-dependent receptor [Steroidobacteraceae bacterium]|jgi:outer membrane receptor protein involved in Fe transport|nr:TonB-dependent receptor [Steroidobacteraceae bacterium]
MKTAARGAAAAIAAVLAGAAPADAQVAGASSSSDESPALDEIVVHAERLDRSLLNTATSVFVVDAAQLEQQPIDGTRDLLEHLPNVTSVGTGNFAPAVRGVDGTGPAQGADAFLAGTRPRLNVQIDGRPASYNEIIFGDVGIWDVQQVEALLGPQSTLQGRNAIAGTIAVKTKDPTFTPEATARILGGNFDTREYDAAVSAPIIDNQVAFRLAAEHRSSESFVAMTPFDTARDPAEFESTTARGKLLIQPSALSNFSTLVTLNFSEVRGPQAETISRPFNSYVSSTPQMPVFQPRTGSGIVATNWQFSDSVTLSNTLSYTDLNIKRFAPTGTGNANIDGREIVEEPLLKFGHADGTLSGLAGLYYFHNHQDEFLDLFGGGTFKDSTRTSAAFGEFTYAPSSQFDVTAGARYEEEQRRRNGTLFIFSIDLDKLYKAFLPKLVLSWHPTKTITFGVDAQRGYNGGGAGFTYAPPFASYTYDPEYVWNYEGFVRASLADGKVMLTANAFYSRYHDMQLPFNLSALSAVIRNADDAETHGLEFGARWRPVRALELFSDIGLLKAKITSYPGSGTEGNDLPRSPALTGDFGVNYTVLGGLELDVDARYSDDYFSDVPNTLRLKVGPYWVSNAQAGYRFQHWRVFGYVKNIFNSDRPTLLYPGTTPDLDSANILHPRAYGLGVQVDF